ncbi:conjugated bile salt MFS transporter [Clostridium sp. CCUG 7971]|uniref:conjugated bile salt MFS transporter n=1 Tax=Clostridium sp. CCUG 7971 TaxID=2811414 RepID=UPI001ABA88AA|nr:conjugated bile salt MFS transporter [Clostridium sp. CCUG 7971]MBO3446268.1 conjugated bile salt MFS transporter [Clostridium sp. CCUG 7971]
MSTLNQSKKKFATGWLIVVACMLIQAIPFGVAANIQPQFVSYVVEEHGFTLAGFSLIFTLGTVVSAIASPIIGMMFNKINAKVMYLLGCILSGGGFLAFSMCQELWQFYIVAGVVQVGTAAISSIGVPLLINGWFDELSKGKAMGLAFAGGSIGNIFLQQMTAFSLASNGASKSYMLFGALSLIVGIPVTLLFLRMPKNDSEIVKGSKKENGKEGNSQNTVSVDWGYTFKEAKNLKFFWVFALGLFFLGMYVSALAVQYPAYLKVHLKLAPVIVGSVGSIFALFSLGGNLFGGIIFDKLGVTKGLMVASVLAFISCLALMFSGSIPQLAFVFAALKGLSVFAYMMGPSLLAGSFFGKKEFGAILGVVQIFFAVGFAAGSSVFGALVDNLGYGVAWSAILVFIVICYGSLILASIGMAKLNKERIAKLELETKKIG